MKEKFVLIDGHSILSRAFYGIPDLTAAGGLHTNGVYGFLNILFNILEEEQPRYLTVAFDVKAPTFRHELYQEYKGTRKPMPGELRQQVPVLHQVLQAMGIAIVEKAGYEADDIIGTLAKRGEAQGVEVVIVSGDRDLLQLVSEHITLRIPKTKKTGTEIEDYTPAEIREKYQIAPEQIVDLKALMGDSSDNIPGIPGVGEKTAAKIIAQFGSIENAMAHVAEIKPNKAKESLEHNYELAQLSKKLAAICTDCELDYDLEGARIGELFTQEAYILFKKLEFKNHLSRFEGMAAPALEVAEKFQKVSGRALAEEVFAKAGQAGDVGVELLREGQGVLGLSIAFSDEDIYFMQVGGELDAGFLLESLTRLAEGAAHVSSLDMKQLLGEIALNYSFSLFDAGIAAYLLNPLKSNYLYEDIAKEYLDMLVPSRADLLGKSSFSQALLEQHQECVKCACLGAYVAYKSRAALEGRLRETEMYGLFADIEMPLVCALRDMEENGIRARQEVLEQISQEFAVRLQELEQEIYGLAGEDFNINSPKQLGVILFERLKLPYGKKTKTGYSTAAGVLEKLEQEHPIVAKILEYRQFAKLKSTYADGLVNYIGADGRIHSKFHQTITATGRISSAEPNLQNIPVRVELGRMIRKAFVPEEGYVFLDADYSQIELRVLAHLSGDETLIQAYREASDIHALTASQVFHVPMEEVTSLQRRNAKAVNFGIVYGISSFGLSQDLSITKKEAETYIDNYFQTYPGIKSFLDGLVKQAREAGYVSTMYHRRRPVPELQSDNFMQRSFGERVAMNAPIQGTAADIIKIAMIRVNDRLKENSLRSRLVLQVHDELLVEAHRDEVEIVKQILTEEMEHAAQLKVPLEIGLSMGECWYETK